MGDDASVRIHWREPDALALLTYEGASILGYQLVQLKTGENRVKVPMQSSLAGHASATVVTRKDLFGEMQLPQAFTERDSAVIPVEVHNSLKGEREIEVTLETSLNGAAHSESQTIEVEGPGVSRIEFPTSVGAEGAATFSLTVKSGDDQEDTVSRTVDVLPYGIPVYGVASGRSSQSTLAFVDLASQPGAVQRALEVVIGPSIDRSLVDAVVGSGQLSLPRAAMPGSSSVERAVSDVLGGVAVLQMIGATRTDDSPEAQALAGRIGLAVSQLISTQSEDGSWSWSGRPDRGNPDSYLSSRVMWAIAVARKAGFAVPNDSFNKGQQYLKSAFAQLPRSDRNGQTFLLLGMASCGCADFAFANRLHRERNQLSPAGLVHLALVLAELDRNEMATELIRFVKLPTEDDAVSDDRVAPWMSSGVELRAMYLLALDEIDSRNAHIGPLAEWLIRQRVGSRWPIEKSNGPAIAALAAWNSRSRHSDEKYKLTIRVNDQEIETLTFDPSVDKSRRIEIPLEVPNPVERQKVEFECEGRGTFSYSAVLNGFVPADKLKSSTSDWSVSRQYLPRLRMLDGKTIPRGFDVVNGSYKSFTNPMTQLPVGVDAHVTLMPRRHNTTGQPGEQYDYLVITEPIPAGCTVLEESVSGQFERFEIEPGQITFYVGNRRYPNNISYRLTGYVPGEYKVSQTVVRSFYNPQKIAVGKTKLLTVLESGREPSDKYRLTPDELYHLGKRLLAKGENAKAHEHLSTLFSDWRLDADKYKDVTTMLFQTSLVRNTDSEIVKYFEIIKERFPDVEVSFENILRVALAYRGLGEYERSYLVYRATVQGSFERESQVAGFLTARAEFARSVQVMERLLRDYPAESYMATATYALAQEIYRKAPVANEDARLKKAGVTRVHLIQAAITMLDHFLTTWPLDPAADQASFAAATALLDLDQYQAVIDRCEEYARRYPDSRLIDSFWYIIGYCHFELGEHEQALAMCRKVAESRFKVSATGAMRDADNKWEAIYIMGQVHHSLGDASDAIAEYEKVRERFKDADEAINFFSRKAISVEDVTTLAPKDKKSLTLKYRNVAEAALKVYRIDLMKFGLMQRNLDRITAINLAGIKPYHEETIKLGDGKDYRDVEKAVDLPLEDEGAYLVVCRGGDLYASGLVVVSPLDLEVQEDSVSGRVRVTVKDRVRERFVNKVHVKVIGTANDEFNSGHTDLRGLFIADDVQGTSTIIALADKNRYAFYRGTIPLQGVTPNQAPAAPEEDAAGEAAPQAVDGKQLLRSNVFNQNGKFQSEQKANFDDLLNNDRSGVKTKEAY